MGREVRMVPKNWEHPRTEKGHLRPMCDGCFYQERLNEWLEKEAEWNSGKYPDYADEESKLLPFAEWYGDKPNPEYYMPSFPDGTADHYMMYEDTTEGTPISPAFETPEELARWLFDSGASAFGGQTASYEGWLRVAKGGYSPSMILKDGVMTTGVDL